MEVEILHLIDGAKQAKGTTVIIDVFRAFTVETYLSRNNAAKIIPVGDVQIAFDYKEKHPDAILCGERKGIIIDGFDYGNSPAQIEHVDFTGKTVIHTTSAGTQGIANASGADEIIAGNLVAAKAIARYIRAKNPEHVSLVCMGLAGDRQTDEDELCGKYLKALIEGAPLHNLEHHLNRLKYTDGAKFFDPAKQAVFPERDYHLCTAVDSCDFILRLKKDPETGLSCMERIDVPPIDVPNPVTKVENGAMMSSFERIQAMDLPDDVKRNIIYGNITEATGFFDAALVLGGTPSVMKGRAEAAAKLWAEGRCKLFIPTGGVCWETEFGFISESQTLKQYMLRCGVPEEAIICEDGATTTHSNMTLSKPILAEKMDLTTAKIAVVTSAFHMYRSLALAKAYIPESEFFGVSYTESADTPESFMNDPDISLAISKECYCLSSYVKRGLIPDFQVKPRGIEHR